MGILTYSARGNRLVNTWAADHTATLAGGIPILVLDTYEHAYHMDFAAKAADYVSASMDVIKLRQGHPVAVVTLLANTKVVAVPEWLE